MSELYPVMLTRDEALRVSEILITSSNTSTKVTQALTALLAVAYPERVQVETPKLGRVEEYPPSNGKVYLPIAGAEDLSFVQATHSDIWDKIEMAYRSQSLAWNDWLNVLPIVSEYYIIPEVTP